MNKALYTLVASLFLASTSFAAAAYRCPITQGDLAGADTVTLVEDCSTKLNLAITGHGQKLVDTMVQFDSANSDEHTMIFKSQDRKTYVYVEKDAVGLKVQVSALNYIVRSNYCQQTAW